MVHFMANNFNPFKASAPSRKATLIIAATRQLIAEFGSDAVTRKRVAERAGLKPAEVSRVFRDRASLMRAVAATDEH